jgi:hypothetical protein
MNNLHKKKKLVELFLVVCSFNTILGTFCLVSSVGSKLYFDFKMAQSIFLVKNLIRFCPWFSLGLLMMGFRLEAWV